MTLGFFCDDQRHLVCIPYSVDNLHKMAEELRIKRCWFHSSVYPHYDIPKRRILEIKARCTVVSPRDILAIIKGTYREASPEALDDRQKTPEVAENGD